MYGKLFNKTERSKVIMKKSYNDIKEQEQRVIAMCKESGRYCNNARNRLNIQQIARITRNTLTQHGFPIFGEFDKNERRDIFHYEQPANKLPQTILREPQACRHVQPTPTEVAGERMRMNDWFNADKKNRKQLQDACRHIFIRKMYAELLTDMEICKMENWDVLEFPRMLRDAISTCFPKPRQLSLFD